jgi:chromosome partitioning protein
LLIDLDAQANLTYSLGIQAHELSKKVYELLKGGATLEEVMLDRDGVKVIPASLDLSGAEVELSGIPGREFLLKEVMSKGNVFKHFDYTLVDCPPSLGLLTLNALIVSNEVYIPIQTEYLALQGVSMLLRTVETIKGRFNKGLDVTGVIGTRYDGRKRLNQEVAERIRSHFGVKMFRTLIRDNISLAEAPSYGQTIFEYKPQSYGAEDYLSLSREIIKRG